MNFSLQSGEAQILNGRKNVPWLGSRTTGASCYISQDMIMGCCLCQVESRTHTDRAQTRHRAQFSLSATRAYPHPIRPAHTPFAQELTQMPLGPITNGQPPQVSLMGPNIKDDQDPLFNMIINTHRVLNPTRLDLD